MPIIIKNEEHYKKQIKKAKDDGTWFGERGLYNNLSDLHSYGGLEDPEKIKVEIGYDFSGLSLTWFRKDKNGEFKVWMTGGLIYHKSANEWSTHT